VVSAVAVVLAACGGGPQDAATGTPAAPLSSSAAPRSAAPSVEVLAIVGTWHRAQSCDEVVAAFTSAGLATSHTAWAQGNFFGGAGTPPAERPCEGALGPLEHDHFFLGNGIDDGTFGSHDQAGQQVDDGDFTVVDGDTLAFPSHAREFGYTGDLVVDYAIEGDTAHFDVKLPASCEAPCQDAYAWALSAFASGPWQRGSVPRCPNPDGGDGNRCLGDLAAGTFQTAVFAPGVRYTVPPAWLNLEDMRGNFLLVAPGGTLAGIADGSSDYIGVYAGVAIADGDCDEAPAEGVEGSARAMASALADRPGLTAAQPQAKAVGGLEGRMVDIALAPDWTGSCPFAPGIPVVPLIIGVGPAGLHHVAIAGPTTRFYFLDGATLRDGTTTNIAIEVNDAPGGTSLDALAAVVDTFAFGMSNGT
jgi:hypothetical protein